ncbi:hypothetical protein [Desulfosoma caldarium]|uniref:Uncharacterized protein n=1 Tax=Desulfosoma caldarium TaxID=610254 RepID=A0A3N1VMS5_9BACT|nr:hypothetical protein [Desulfosoma caldarium]ROR03359.1 hypothetical protein EDC27_0135 [Desulfosoma caldarium]
MERESRWTLSIDLAVGITMLRHATLFYALVLAFWRFQSLSAASHFMVVLQAVQERARAQLLVTHPGRFRDKGGRVRRWRLPFGEACIRLCKLHEKETGHVLWPLKWVLDLPERIRWCEATLLPGYHLAVIQSFRQSRKALQGTVPDAAAPSASTLYRRFQDFLSHLDPLPDLGEGDSAASWPYRPADRTKLKLQHKGFDAGMAGMRLVVGSRTPFGPLEVLDFSIGESWEDIGPKGRQALLASQSPGLRGRGAHPPGFEGAGHAASALSGTRSPGPGLRPLPGRLQEGPAPGHRGGLPLHPRPAGEPGRDGQA